MQYLTKSILKQVYPKRNPWVHKGMFGRLLAITGSERYTGSPIFVGLAAYRAGCDLVYLVGPKRAMDISSFYSPELISKPLEGKYLEEKHVREILLLIDEIKPDVIVIGPSLWRTQPTRKAIVRLIEQIDLPMVIDADAIRAISAEREILKNKTALLLPHDNEFFELTGVKASRTSLNDRIKIVVTQSQLLNTTILLKGHIDIISNGEKTILNKTGSVYMTKGGCGDTLAGICGALLAKKIDTFTAACAGSYINGLAGELAAKKYGEGLLPTDLIEEIPRAIKEK
jgi:NAD(P)H-hydrate epimerase